MYGVLVKEYGFHFAEEKTPVEMFYWYADLINQFAEQNPETNDQGKPKPVIYPYLKVESE